MVLVLLFIALMLSMYSVSYRQLASALRIEHIRLLQSQRDEGSTKALARGLSLLETGLPPTDPFVCGVTIDTSVGQRSYTVTYSGEGANLWAVHVAPTQPMEDPPPMPEHFAEPP
jgi:hypothetical protein